MHIIFQPTIPIGGLHCSMHLGDYQQSEILCIPIPTLVGSQPKNWIFNYLKYKISTTLEFPICPSKNSLLVNISSKPKKFSKLIPAPKPCEWDRYVERLMLKSVHSSRGSMIFWCVMMYVASPTKVHWRVSHNINMPTLFALNDYAHIICPKWLCPYIDILCKPPPLPQLYVLAHHMF